MPANDQQEQARFVHYAAQFRTDGEAICLAIAEARGWSVATDDRKAIPVARRAALTVMSDQKRGLGIEKGSDSFIDPGPEKGSESRKGI